jgi:three-Cys-motif partner protein
MTGLYQGREQTAAKHFILRSYLQALAFKVLQGGLNELAYVDGFSGPWESRDADHSDTSFMIAIRVLKDVQRLLLERSGQRKLIRCFFVEANPRAHANLAAAVAPYHNPDNGFIIETHQARFQDTIPNALRFIGRAFPLVFIDPKGWTGYPFEVIRPLLRHQPSEVLINFMYDYINRFAASNDPGTIASLGEILGGEDWVSRLDPNLPRGPAVEQLFRDVLAREGKYDSVLSTCIEKSTQDRPHFFIVYGTRHPSGVKTFRKVEYDALSAHERLRQTAKNRKQAERIGMDDLFGGATVRPDETLDYLVGLFCAAAIGWAGDFLRERGPVSFETFSVAIMQHFMLRETNAKDICVSLARDGVITDTWKSDGKRKPHGHHRITLVKSV